MPTHFFAVLRLSVPRPHSDMYDGQTTLRPLSRHRLYYMHLYNTIIRSYFSSTLLHNHHEERVATRVTPTRVREIPGCNTLQPHLDTHMNTSNQINPSSQPTQPTANYPSPPPGPTLPPG